MMAQTIVGGSNYFDTEGGHLENGKIVMTHPLLEVYGTETSKIETQLKTMFVNGMKHVAIVIWYGTFDTVLHRNLKGLDVWAHVLRNNNGNLVAKHQANLSLLLKKIESLGFERVTLRFGLQMNRPEKWTAWDEQAFLLDGIFPINVSKFARAQIKTRMCFEPIETENVHPFMFEYGIRLWQKWINENGPQPCGIGIAGSFGSVQVGRAKAFNAEITNRGIPIPKTIMSHVYKGDPVQVLKALRAWLMSEGKGYPIFVVETYYQDTIIASAIKSLPFPLAGICQWPLVRGSIYTTDPMVALEWSAYQ